MLLLLNKLTSMGRMRGLRGVDARAPFAVAVLIGALLLVALPATADPKDKLDRLEQRKQHAAEQEAKYEAKRKELLSTIAGIDRKRAKVESKVNELDTRLSSLDQRIAVVKDNLIDAQMKVSILTEDLQDVLGELDSSTDDYTARAIEAYKGGPSAYIESVLGSGSFSDVIDKVNYWQAALDSDAELIEQIQLLRDQTENRREVILEKQHEIAMAKKELEENRSAVAAVRSQHAAVLAQRQALLDAKETLLAEVEDKEAYYSALQDQLEAESEEFRALLAGGSSGPLPTGGGQLLWPTAGAVTSGYGYRTHPIFGDQRLHTGIDIGGGYGNPVVAADTGTVSYVGVMSGYGNVIIIDHGGGLATTYNHLSEQHVSSGSTVQRGTTIGAVGCTGYCTGPHLHFEVRVNGSPVDPMPYLQ
jgi:murein DD-endopeptidase MepM/ murein hydrolase activator NlpD